MARRFDLRKEIVLTLVIKVLLLWGLWYAFFRTPVDEDITPADLERRLLAPTATQEERHP